MVHFFRFLFFALPFLATILSLVGIVLIGTAGLNPDLATTKNLFFLKADTRAYSEDLLEVGLPDNTSTSVSLGMADYVIVNLWDYCFMLDSNTPDDVSPKLWCSQPSIHYSFDPLAIWSLRDPNHTFDIPASVEASIKSHATMSKWIIAGYGLAFIFTCLELLAGITASYHRWGSVLVTVIALISSASLIVASIIATYSFIWIKNSINTQFKVSLFSLGSGIFITTWIATGLALVATLFWCLTFCACSRWGENKQKQKGYGSHKYVPAMGGEDIFIAPDHSERLLEGEKIHAGERAGHVYEPYRSQTGAGF